MIDFGKIRGKYTKLFSDYRKTCNKPQVLILKQTPASNGRGLF